MDTIEVLQQLDVEPRESRIYLALLSSGPASIRDIADKANINRGTTYELLKRMQQQGIVSYFPKGKRKFFSAEPPERLLQLAEHKQSKLNEAVQKLQSEIVPSLNSLQPATGRANVHYYEGDDGLELVLKDILATVGRNPEKSYSVISTKLIRNFLYRPFPNYTRQRVRAGIKVRVIAIGEGGEGAELSERKWIDATHLNQAAAYIAIYPPKLAMISLSEGNLPTATVIESGPIVATQQLLFDTLWGQLPGSEDS